MDHVRLGLKQDTWNQFRNAPLFTAGLFSDSVIAVPEQDISKQELASSAQGPGLDAFQHSSKNLDIDSSLMIGKIASNLPSVSLNLSPGGNFQQVVMAKDMVVWHLGPLTSPNSPEMENSINENYSFSDPRNNQNVKSLDLIQK